MSQNPSVSNLVKSAISGLISKLGSSFHSGSGRFLGHDDVNARHAVIDTQQLRQENGNAMFYVPDPQILFTCL